MKKDDGYMYKYYVTCMKANDRAKSNRAENTTITLSVFPGMTEQQRQVVTDIKNGL